MAPVTLGKQLPSDSLISFQLSSKDSEHAREITEDLNEDTIPGLNVGSNAEEKVLRIGDSIRRARKSLTFDLFKKPSPHASVKPVRRIEDTPDPGGVMKLWPKSIFSSDEEALEDRLRAALVCSCIENEKVWLPRSSLEALVTSKSIRKELPFLERLRRHPSNDWKWASTFRVEPEKREHGFLTLRTRSTSQLLIRKKERTYQGRDRIYRQIFAILVLMGKQNSIWDFVREQVCDSVLPDLHLDENTWTVYLPRIEGISLKCFQGWNEVLKKRFFDTRQMILVPDFLSCHQKGKHLSFNTNDILPFTKWKSGPDKGSSGVYEAEIHADYHIFQKNVVAVKHLAPKTQDPDESRELFMIESGILRALCQRHHVSQHLIELLATFSWRGQNYLIFPWADGDLEDYWERTTPTAAMSQWLLEQLKGLLDALKTIHNYETTLGSIMPHERSTSPQNGPGVSDRPDHLRLIGRHGDIKPSNILWFNQHPSNNRFGILKITDFGIARFTPGNLESKRRQGFVPNSHTYRSPECDFKGMNIGPLCDIWALGCVYLVFLSWFFGGYLEVKRFYEKRSSPDRIYLGMKTDCFFTVNEDGNGEPRAVVKRAVSEVRMLR